MAISKFEANLSPGLRELGFAFKIPDAGRSHKPFDFVLGMGATPHLRFIGVEGKTARGNRFHFGSRWREHQRNALQSLWELDRNAAWVALHYPDVPDFRALLMPWQAYLMVEEWYEKSIPWHAWGKHSYGFDESYKLTWEHGPRRQKKYWRVPGGHMIRQEV